MQRQCKYCQSEELAQRHTANVHKSEVYCVDCGKHQRWGKIDNTLLDGTYDFKVVNFEEINEKFILFKLKHQHIEFTKKIWRDHNGAYYNNLKQFINFFTDLDVHSICDLFKIIHGKRVMAKVENITRNGKTTTEIQYLEKIL